MTAEEVCSALGVTRDGLYYNFGYTSNSVDYAKNHKENKVTYPETEKKISVRTMAKTVRMFSVHTF